MAVGLLNIVVLLMYLCVMKDVLFERLLFWSFRPKIFSVRIFEDLCRDRRQRKRDSLYTYLRS